MPSPSHPHAAPRARLLSNGSHTVMLTDAGSGFSHWRDLAVTRWREDPTCDGWGSYFLLRDAGTGAVWSAGLQPSGGEPDGYATTDSPGCTRIVRREGALETTLETAVAGDRDVELRRLTLTHRGDAIRTLEVTSYAELVLGPDAGDASHPAFSKIFVQTEWVEQDGVLVATRRRGAPEEPEVWAAHRAVVEGQDGSSTEYETDRARFLGRGRTLRNAAAMEAGRALSNTAGAVLDPIFSLRRRVRLAPGASVRIAFWTCLAATRDAVLELARDLDAPDAGARTMTSAAAYAEEQRARLGIDEATAERCRRLVAPLLYADAAWRAPADQLERGSGGPPVLWASGISGDRPIVLLHVAFADLSGLQTSWTCDRTEFLGRHGAVDRPAALAHGRRLSGRTGAGLDPCAALQTEIELAPDARAEITFLLGDAASPADGQALLRTYRHADVDAVLQDVAALWHGLVGAVQVRTPDRAMDILLNDWLLYQTLSCRVWARAAYYQSSGAYGFRDQLQDGLALCVARPDLVREHLLRSAARQFVEGDVQHWWLPPAGQGLRTRITDDRIWLPYVTMHYAEVTGEVAVLDEIVPFLDGPTLEDDELEAFFQPEVSAEDASLYEHCARALDASLSLGPHGLPLFGTGDWNDGMNRVGVEGRGESVWMAWFLLDTLARFTPIAQARGDHGRAKTWRRWAATVRAALGRDGWDGAWYRRGYYDDGTPLGSASSDECKIDAIAQSWSVISGAADPARAAQAMAALDAHLVDRDTRVAMLFTPPFDRAEQDPGYVKGYPPGIRENGGQYTHGSVWSVFAWAKLGDGDKAGELFDLINPIRHAGSAEAIERYKVEPYVSCADVYSVAPLAGRGGWTWYTGSAGWLYRAGLEAMLGFHVRVELG